MKILFVFEHFYPYIGGAEELFLGLTTSLAQKGHEITVVTTLHNKSLLKEEKFRGVHIVRINCYNRFLFTFLSLPKIISLAKKCDVIQTASYNAATPAFLAGLFCRKKVIITFHEVWGKLWFSLPYKSKFLLFAYYWYEQFIVRLPFYKYIAVSKFTLNALKSNGIPEYKVSMIYNGLDYSIFNHYSNSTPSTFTFCFFGRLGISKGLNLLIEAFDSFSKINSDAKLKLIIPTYPKNLYKNIFQKINNIKMRNKVEIFHDLEQKDLFAAISSSSCVIIPSYSEGFCFTAAESVAMGVPVISSGKGALTEVVGGNHIHLKSLTAEHIVEAMERAIKNDWDYIPPKQFLLSDCVSAYEKLYMEALSET